MSLLLAIYFSWMEVVFKKDFTLKRVGANEYKFLSTTYFFDKCLGWDGLCSIEPQEQYHKDLKEQRSCTLVPKCLTDKPTKMLIGDGAGASVKPYTEGGAIPKGSSVVDCEPLDQIMKELKLPSSTRWICLFWTWKVRKRLFWIRCLGPSWIYPRSSLKITRILVSTRL
jgi:hypothetical protein